MRDIGAGVFPQVRSESTRATAELFYYLQTKSTSVNKVAAGPIMARFRQKSLVILVEMVEEEPCDHICVIVAN